MAHINNLDPFPPAPETNCTTCRSRSPLVTFLPCNHNEKCLACVAHFARERICPICNDYIDQVLYPGRSEKVMLQDIFTYQDAVDLDTRKKTLQVMFIGSATSAKASIIDGFMNKFPMYPITTNVRGPFRGIFRPNVKPFGHEMRVGFIPKDTFAETRKIDIDWHKPDVMVILIEKTASYLRLDFQEFNGLSKDPDRSVMWVLVPGPEHLPASPSPSFVESRVREIPLCKHVIEGNSEFIDLTKSNRGLERAALMEKIVKSALESRHRRLSEFVGSFSHSSTSQIHSPNRATPDPGTT